MKFKVGDYVIPTNYPIHKDGNEWKREQCCIGKKVEILTSTRNSYFDWLVQCSCDNSTHGYCESELVPFGEFTEVIYGG